VGFNHSAKTLKLEMETSFNQKKMMIEPPNKNLLKIIKNSLNNKNVKEIKEEIKQKR